MLRATDYIIGEHNADAQLEVVINGERKSRGGVPRNFETHPTGCYATGIPMRSIADLKPFPRDEIIPRIQELVAQKAQMSDLRRTSGPNGGIIPSLDQDGVGYCWCHSGTMGTMLARAKAGLPYVRLSAFFVGCLIKNYQDEGGWGAEGLDFIIKNGIPTVDLWPEKSMKRSNDNAAVRQNALLHKVVESFIDLEAAQYDRNVTEDQAITLLLMGCPLVGDFNWWGHSVILMDATLNVQPTEATSERWKRKLATDLTSLDLNDDVDRKVFGDIIGKRGLNSWTDDYGDKGEFVLTGNHAHLDGGVAIRTTTISDS